VSKLGIPIALTIAGSDSSGGAGIQADLRTFAALSVHGATAITAITAQSTAAVQGVWPLPPDAVRAQIAAVLEDLEVGAIKTGMLHGAPLVRAVASAIASRAAIPLVVDPIAVSSSGTPLLDAEGLAALVEDLLPRARLITPNLDETERLLGARPATIAEMIAAARAIVGRLGAKAVLIKGGHLDGDPSDVLVDGAGEPRVLGSRRIETSATHGTGCTYAAAITALLARGAPLDEAVDRAQRFVHDAILAASRAPKLGRGKGPLHQLHAFYPWPE
jgi:hydroxymethylpyrimidine/phosphomethylpyrimidine kinase